MAKKKGLTWTDKQLQIRDLIQNGKKWDEIEQITGASRETISKVVKAIEADLKEEKKKVVAKEREIIEPHRPPSEPPADPNLQTRYRIPTSEPQALGEIQALPEDWRITQHGVFLLLDTYYLTKEELGYEGTMGEFLTDIGRFYRVVMHYAMLPEVGPALVKHEEGKGNGRREGEETSEGGVLPGDSSQGDDAKEQRAEA